MGLKSKSIIAIIVVLLYSCNTSFTNEKDFFNWLNNKKNGFVKETSANRFLLTMKYLPPEYLAFNEISKSDDNNKSFNDYLEEFKNSRTFLLIISPEDIGVDVSKYGIFNMDEYKQRIHDLNFNIKERIYIQTDNGKKYHPNLTTMENLYEVSNKKRIYLVFAENQAISNSKTLDVVFIDDFLDTGINHFLFKKDKIDNIPQIKF